MAFAFFTPAPINHLKCGGSDSSNFTYPVSGTYPRLATVSNGGRVQNANGYDIRPYADSAGTTALAFELVAYNATTGYVEMWVKVPTLSHTTDTPIYLFYADSGISTNGSSTSAWDSSFGGVYHLNEATGSNLVDSTSNAYGLTQSNSPTQGASKIGGGLTFDGSTQKATQTSAATVVNPATTDLTLSTWINVTSFAGYRRFLMQSIDASTTFQLLTGDDNSGTSTAFTFIVFDGATEHAIATPTGYATGTWYQITARYNTSTNSVALAINGSAISPLATSGFSVGTADNKLWMGARSDGTNFFPGSLDEVRVANVRRSDDWLTAEYNSQNDPSTFYTFGTEQTFGGTIASGTGLALSPSQALAIGVAIAFGGGSAASASLAYAVGAAIAAGSGNAPSQSLSRAAGAAIALGSGITLSQTLAVAAGAVIASGSGASFSTSVGFGNSSAIIIATGTAASFSSSAAFAAAVAIASGTGVATSPSAAVAAGSSIASGVGNTPSVSVVIGFGASFVLGTGRSQSVSFMRGVALGTAAVPPFYPPGRFLPDDVTARFACDDVTARFTPLLSTP